MKLWNIVLSYKCDTNVSSDALSTMWVGVFVTRATCQTPTQRQRFVVHGGTTGCPNLLYKVSPALPLTGVYSAFSFRTSNTHITYDVNMGGAGTRF
jgi:hypothetical protein